MQVSGEKINNWKVKKASLLIEWFVQVQSPFAEILLESSL